MNDRIPEAVFLFLFYFLILFLLAAHLLFLLHDHLLNHFAADGTCLSRRQVAVVSLF